MSSAGEGDTESDCRALGGGTSGARGCTSTDEMLPDGKEKLGNLGRPRTVICVCGGLPETGSASSCACSGGDSRADTGPKTGFSVARGGASTA